LLILETIAGLAMPLTDLAATFQCSHLIPYTFHLESRSPRETLDSDIIAKVRHCANKGLILGSEKFRQQFKEITGDRAE